MISGVVPQWFRVLLTAVEVRIDRPVSAILHSMISFTFGALTATWQDPEAPQLTQWSVLISGLVSTLPR